VACKDKVLIFDIDYNLSFQGWADWDESAMPYVQTFLTLHPNYTEADFDNFITDLQNRGYGWLRPEGVRAKLIEMRQPEKKGLFSLFGKKK